jgi:hypothetical protein
MAYALYAIAEALRGADTQYTMVKADFDHWTGALANIVNVLHQYCQDPRSSFSGQLPAFPWQYNVLTFKEFEAAHLAGQDMSAQAQDAHPVRPTLRSRIVDDGGSAILTLLSTDAEWQVYSFSHPTVGSRQFVAAFPNHLNPTMWGADFSAIQDTVRTRLRDPYLFDGAQSIVADFGSLANAYRTIALPRAANDSRLPTIAR